MGFKERGRVNRSALLDVRRWLVCGLVLVSVGCLCAVASASRWSAVVLPKLGKQELPSSLYSVSCTSSRSCLAVGDQIAERWDGSRWRLIAPATRRTGAVVTSVSCSSIRACTAVGAMQRGHSIPLVKRWNGSRWQTQPSPDPASHNLPGLTHDSRLTAVDCTSRHACVAVGQYGFSSAVGRTLIERWNGQRWSSVKAPQPAGALSSALESVSCRSARACITVGDYLAASPNGVNNLDVPLIERWNGSRWSIQPPATLTRAAPADLTGVSCPRDHFCAAVGSVAPNTLSEQPLAENWAGLRWSRASAPLPVGADQGALLQVSCSSATACAAVGGYHNNATGLLGVLLAHQDAGAWTLAPLPLQRGLMFKSLLSVSCPASSWCMAVGNDLAERYH